MRQPEYGMVPMNRRVIVAGIAAGLAEALATPLLAQTAGEPPVNHFGFEDVLKRAR